MTDIGRIHEENFARRVGGSLVPRSGAGWSAKLDVGGGATWIFSCKATANASMPVTEAIIEEMVTYANSMGDVRPALSIELLSKGTPIHLVVLTEDDFLALIHGEISAMPSPSEKVDAKWARAEIPQILRDLDG